MITLPMFQKELYLLPNRPCLISPSLTSSWPCFRYWTLQTPPESDALPNWQYLSQTYGAQDVSVADCNIRDFSDQRRSSMTMSHAIETLVDAKNLANLPYVKDWHLILQSTTLSNQHDRLPYETPNIFRDDCAWALLALRIVKFPDRLLRA